MKIAGIHKKGYQKNYAVNGSLGNWQRQISFTNPADFTMLADMWQMRRTLDVTAAVNVARSTDVPNAASKYSMEFTVTSAQASFPVLYAAGYYAEGTIIRDTYGSRLYIGFWAKSSVAGDFGAYIGNYDFSQMTTPTFTINQANTWEYKQFVLDIPDNGTYFNNQEVGVQFILVLANGALNTLLPNNGATFKIAQLTMSDHPVSQNMIFNPAGSNNVDELKLCQRYYETGKIGLEGYDLFATNPSVPLEFVVEKRAVPTLSFTDTLSANVTAPIVQWGGGIHDTKRIVISRQVDTTGSFFWAATYTANAHFTLYW